MRPDVVSRFKLASPAGRMIEQEPVIQLIGHPAAPRLSSGSDAPLLFSQLLGELSNGNFPVANGELRLLLREASLTSLFFFLKYIAGYSGPYDKLSETLHVELCNFRQAALEPGCKAAAFIPRSSFKSTCMTHGPAAWELLRNPELRIGIFSSKFERAAEFMHTAQRTFDENDLFAWLFPEFVPTAEYGSRWNDKEAVLPNRLRNYPEPNLKAHSAGGSTAGVHVDLALFDDIIDDSMLNADHGATADLYRMRNWLFTNMRTLLIGQESRVILSATRYAIDDPYETIMKDSAVQCGYWGTLVEEYPVQSTGEWAVYYRRALEGSDSIFPEAYTQESLEKLAATDPWTYQTQYLNDPKAASVLEFISLRPKSCTVDWNNEREDFEIELQGAPGKPEHVSFRDVDLVLALDPAATERYVTQRTSKSGIVVMARDYKDRFFFVEAVAGYWSPSQYIDRLFLFWDKYKKFRATFVEMQAGFKVLGDIIRQEEQRRGRYLNLRPINALAHKEDTIRSVWEPHLRAGRVYANIEACGPLLSELALFPTSPSKDCLDAGKIAIANSFCPGRPADSNDGVDPEIAALIRQRVLMNARGQADPVTGY